MIQLYQSLWSKSFIKEQCSFNEVIRFNTPVRSDLWDYSDTYVVVEWRIIFAGTNNGHIKIY